ncbi:hypothetical protein [Streptosporangium sandarakinum]
MIELTSGDLEEVLTLVTGQQEETPGEILHVARREQPSLVATLLSAWEREGRDLGPALSHELRQQRARTDFYRGVQAGLGRAWPEAVPLKGLEVADRYPDALVRYMNDLDYWFPQRDRLWEAAGLLLANGWSMHTATFMLAGGDLQFLLSLRRLPEDPYALPYGIELSTTPLVGDRIGVPVRTALPALCADPVVKNLVALLFERFEQPYRARDLVDAAVLLTGAPRRLLASCALAVHELALWPEYAELAALLEESPFTVPRLPGDERALVRASRMWRRATAASGLRRPFGLAVTALQNGMMNGSAGVLGRRAWDAVSRRMSPRAALDAGLPLFALPVEGDDLRAEGLTLIERDGVLWAHTPVGGFVLVHGDEIDEELLAGAKVTGGMREEPQGEKAADGVREEPQGEKAAGGEHEEPRGKEDRG